jgi:hypothetical protein
MDEFNADPALGIASGGYIAAHEKEYRIVKMPEYHAAGASKMVRMACFKDIGEFVPSLGWDTVDEIRAQMAGWKTRHFDSVPFYHLKKAGAGIGTARWTVIVGEINYLTGLNKRAFALKTLYRLIFGRPRVAEGGMLLLGYLRAWAKRKPRLVNKEEADFYQRIWANHMKGKVQEAFRRFSHSVPAVPRDHGLRTVDRVSSVARRKLPEPTGKSIDLL